MQKHPFNRLFVISGNNRIILWRYGVIINGTKLKVYIWDMLWFYISRTQHYIGFSFITSSIQELYYRLLQLQVSCKFHIIILNANRICLSSMFNRNCALWVLFRSFEWYFGVDPVYSSFDLNQHYAKRFQKYNLCSLPLNTNGDGGITGALIV